MPDEFDSLLREAYELLDQEWAYLESSGPVERRGGRDPRSGRSARSRAPPIEPEHDPRRILEGEITGIYSSRGYEEEDDSDSDGPSHSQDRGYQGRSPSAYPGGSHRPSDYRAPSGFGAAGGFGAPSGFEALRGFGAPSGHGAPSGYGGRESGRSQTGFSGGHSRPSGYGGRQTGRTQSGLSGSGPLGNPSGFFADFGGPSSNDSRQRPRRTSRRRTRPPHVESSDPRESSTRPGQSAGHLMSDYVAQQYPEPSRQQSARPSFGDLPPSSDAPPFTGPIPRLPPSRAYAHLANRNFPVPDSQIPRMPPSQGYSHLSGSAYNPPQDRGSGSSHGTDRPSRNRSSRDRHRRRWIHSRYSRWG